MSSELMQPPENDSPDPILEARLRQAAGSFPYPPTPDLRSGKGLRAVRRSARVSAVGFSLAALGLALVLVLAFSSPVRARVVDWLRIGAVRLQLLDPTALPTEPTPLPPAALLNLAGETSLSEAARQLPFPLRLPDEAAGLGEPQRVYLQQINGVPVVILVWLEPSDPSEIRLVLYEIGQGNALEKQLLRLFEETTVHRNWALWVEGPYLLVNKGGQVEQRRLVTGRTLIWTEDEVTYRLETDLTLEEARDLAESLEEWERE